MPPTDDALPALRRDLAAARVRVAVIGLGVAGLYQAMEFVRAGFSVVGYDVDPKVVARAEAGISAVPDVPDDELRSAIRQGRFSVSTAPAAIKTCAVLVVTVPTVLDGSGRPDTSAVVAAADLVAANATGTPLVIVKSTAYPGMTGGLVAEHLAPLGVAGRDWFLSYVPERGDPGRRDLATSGSAPRIVAGLTDTCRDLAVAFYQALGAILYEASSLLTAELVKLHENTYRFVNIAYVNEIATYCRSVGVDPDEVVALASTKPVGFSPFWPGPGVGGLYVPINPAYLVGGIGDAKVLSMVTTALRANHDLPARIIEAVATRLGRAVAGARVVAVGLGYKAGSGDIRGSASVAVVTALTAAGAHVSAVDPHVDPAATDQLGVPIVAGTHAQFAESDVVVLLTRHPQTPDLSEWSDKLVTVAADPHDPQETSTCMS
jgi:UDP-N-acetyl-D-glucosamine dehydrogenase